MEDILLNNSLKLPCPEGFHVMDDEERSELNIKGNGPGVCLSNPERHIIVSIGWQQVGGLTSLLLKSGDIVKNSEKAIRKSMQSYGYQLEGFLQRSIAGNKADGFAYTYEAKEIPMYGQSCAMKIGKVFYYFHFYARQAFREESLEIWEEILDSVR